MTRASLGQVRRFTHRTTRRAGRWGGWKGYALAALAPALLALLLFGVLRDNDVAAQGRAGERPLTAAEVVAAFRALGLSVEELQQQPLRSSPSGPPATEQEAWGFTIPGLEGGGRILIFADDDGLQKKAAWFRRSGAAVIVFRNVIVWLDPGLEASAAALYRQALQGAR